MSGQYRTDAEIAGPPECARCGAQAGAKCATLNRNVTCSRYIARDTAQKRQVKRDIAAAKEQAQKTAGGGMSVSTATKRKEIPLYRMEFEVTFGGVTHPSCTDPMTLAEVLAFIPRIAHTARLTGIVEISVQTSAAPGFVGALTLETQAALTLALANTTDADTRRWILATLERSAS